MKTLLSILMLSLLTGCTTTLIEKKDSNITKTIHINLDELKNDSNTTTYLNIDNKKVELYTISSNDGRDIHLGQNDEVHNIITSNSHTTSNDEVCIDGDTILKVTLYNFKDEIIESSATKSKCYSVKQIERNGYKFDVEYKNKPKNTIYIDKDNENKKSSKQ